MREEEKMHLISIIVPMYNAEMTIENCVNSILRQDYKTIELLLVDDGSTDNTVNICKSLLHEDNRIVLLTKKNGGVSSARNYGLRKAKGEWISFIDADDYVGPEYLLEMIDATELDEIDIVFSGITVVNDVHKEKILRHSVTNQMINNKEDRMGLIKSCFDKTHFVFYGMCTQTIGYPFSKLFRRECIEGLFFAENVPVREDALFVADAIYNSKRIVFINNASYYYRNQSNSASMKYRPNYSQEVQEYLCELKVRCTQWNLDIQIYYISVLYSYMSWLKLYVMHKMSNHNISQQICLIQNSYKDDTWKEAFDNIDSELLSKPYKTLQKCYSHKDSMSIIFLYYISRIVLR